ncbi:hypothetical protein [Streptomyces sp. cg36]|uniref:hypothetical protein n=1 Tax=Streptomyces sp. cg36 TaxID=3238798 RepID=UPI0034E1D843
MKRHPLLDVVEDIDPDEQYTVKDIAHLTGRAYRTAGRWAAGGHFGEGSEDRVGVHDAGRRRVWTGRELLAAVAAPRPVQDHQDREKSTTWASGCRQGDGCDCIDHHNEDTAQHRRAFREAFVEQVFPAQARADLLKILAAGNPLPVGLAWVQTPPARMWAYARTHPAWGRNLDEALMASRDPNLHHGREHTYRVYGCRCPDCRTAKATHR